MISLRQRWHLLGRLWLVGLLVAGLWGCGMSEKIYEGHFQYGFEVMAFRPCGGSESWWITGEGPVVRALDEGFARLARGPADHIYVRLRGRLSGKGQYGHLNAYPRELRASEILELRPAATGDCLPR